MTAILRVIEREQKEEGPKKHRQEIKERLGESLEKELRELEVKRNEINNKDALQSGQTNV